MPPIPGSDLDGVVTYRDLDDVDAMLAAAENGGRAVVIGGGFIGLEMAENLVHRGFDVTRLEMADQVLGPLDPEMARMVEGYVEHHGVELVLGDGVSEFRQAATGGLEVVWSVVPDPAGVADRVRAQIAKSGAGRAA